MQNTNGVGLVLAGGGGKGAYQAGVLKCLYEEGKLDNVTAISGASIGAVNALIFAMEDISLFDNVWDNINLLTLFDFNLSITKEEINNFSRDEMYELMDKYIDYNKLVNSKYVITTSISRISGNEYITEYPMINNESIEDIKLILAASTALPIIYEPVQYKGNYYQDGGITDNIPIKPLYDLGIREFIIISLSSTKVINTNKYKDAEFKIIKPSYSLGNLVEGTLNFTEKAIDFRKLLGYKDAKRAIKTIFEKDQTYIKAEDMLSKMDYDNIINQIKYEETIDNLTGSIESNLNKYNSYFDKYNKY